MTLDRRVALEADPLGFCGYAIGAGGQVGRIVPTEAMFVAPVLEHHLAIAEPVFLKSV